MAAIAHIKSIPRSKFAFSQSLETPNGTLTSFTTGDFFDISAGYGIKVFLGSDFISPLDFSMLESGGAGTGFDTIQFNTPPEFGDLVFNYYVKR